MRLPHPSKILCVGRNYLDHARELGNEAPAEPLFFFKPPSALVADGDPILLPPGAGRVDFEGEVAFVVGQRTQGIPASEGWMALSHVLPMNDVTARELQRNDAQWTRAKGFDTFAPAGTPVALDELRRQGVDPARLRVETRVNGELRQSGGLDDLLFPVPELVAWISGVMTLEPGDLLLTGTPAGVGPLEAGDEVEVRIPGVGAVRNPVRARPPGLT